MSGGTIDRVRVLAGCLAAAAVLATAAPLPAAGDTARHNPHGRLLGAAHARGKGTLRARPLAAPIGQLVYHGGPVVHDGHVYAIFWEPPGYSFPAGYRTAIAKYFADVAADSGKRTNVYSVNRQYGDAAGPAAYRVAFEGSYTDTHAPPANGCANPQTSVCLNDDQLALELRSFVAAAGLPTGLARQYFLFTPPGVGSCFDASSDPCAFTDYCAYHSYTGASGTILYAVHPYVTAVPSCDVGESPTGTGADAVLNVVSHEHNEIITDPTGGGWFDASGAENGDKCAWTFGTLQGPAGGVFNQVIAGSGYLLQLEWSNLHAGCAPSLVNQRPVAFFTQSGRRVARSRLRFDASAAGDVDGRIASYRWTFGDGARGSGRVAAHAYARAGTYRVRLTVTDDEGAIATHSLDVRVGRRVGPRERARSIGRAGARTRWSAARG
jgi:PKD domain-containing protein